MKNYSETRTYYEPTKGSYIGDLIDLIQENHPACTQFNGTMLFSNPSKSKEEIYNRFVSERGQ